MRVAHCDFSRTWRGGQQQLLLLARELRRRGCAQTFIVEHETVQERLQDEGFEVQAPSSGAWTMLRHAEAMHAHDGRSHGWMLAGAAGARGIRVLSRRVAYRLGRVAGWKMRRLDLVLAVSAFIREQVLGAGVAPERVAVVYDGIDLEAMPPASAREEMRRRLGIADDAPCLTCLGAFSPEKGLPDLLEAMTRLPAECRLLLSGSGGGRVELERQAQELGVGSRIVFAGGTGAETAALVAAGDVFVMPSRQEGLGSAALVAMALRRPIVATAVGGIPELVRAEENGLLAPAGDPAAFAAATRRLLESSALRTRMGDAGRAMVEARFTAGVMAEATLAAYEAAYRRRQLARASGRGQTR